MNLPRDIETLIIQALCPHDKLKLSFTCRRYRQMFGTLKKIISDYSYDINFISRFMVGPPLIDIFGLTTRHNFQACRKFFADNDISLDKLRLQKWNHEYNGVKYKYFKDSGYIIDNGVVFYNLNVIAKIKTIYSNAIVFRGCLYITSLSHIMVITNDGKTKTFQSVSRRSMQLNSPRLCDTFLIIGCKMFHKNGNMYIDDRFLKLIAICDYLMWGDGMALYVRHVPCG